MKPLLETIKSDKIIDENFESIKNVLCGNISFDNMSLRILEGVTKGADTQNLMIHSGNSRPVGWLPLVGDVYVQEISDKYIDIRSTKPQVNYKILVLFGQSITDSALKALGGTDYKTTEEVATTQAIEQIQLIEETVIQYKPLALKSYVHPNPCALAGPPNSKYQRVIAGASYFYIIVGSTAASQKKLWRINKETNVVDSLDFTGLIGTRVLNNMYAFGSDIYVLVSGNGGTPQAAVYKVDTVTFTITASWTGIAPNGSIHNVSDMYVDDNYVYFVAGVSTNIKADLIRINKTTGVKDYVALAYMLGQVYTLGSISYVPPNGATDGALFIVIDNNYKPCVEIMRVAVLDALTGVPLFALTDTIIGTGAFSAKSSISYNGSVYIPVVYSSTHRTYGGTVTYTHGIVQMNGNPPYTTTFVPLGVPTITNITDTIIEDSGYLYIPCLYASSPIGISIIRYDTIIGEVVTAYAPLPASGTNDLYLNGLAIKDNDGTIIYLHNNNVTDYNNFEYATVDFSDYNV